MSIRVLKYMLRKKDVHTAATIQDLAGPGTTQWLHISHTTSRAYLFRLRRASAAFTEAVRVSAEALGPESLESTNSYTPVSSQRTRKGATLAD